MESSESPAWLTEDEQATWFTFVAVLAGLPNALDDQLRRDAGISHFEYMVLAMLSMSPGRSLRMSELAAKAYGSLTRLSRTVDRLERRGWVVRSPDPDDGRYTRASLTEDGWDKVVATAPGHVEEVWRLTFAPLTRTQIRHLREICERIHRAIDPAGCRFDSATTKAPS